MATKSVTIWGTTLNIGAMHRGIPVEQPQQQVGIVLQPNAVTLVTQGTGWQPHQRGSGSERSQMLSVSCPK